ncbi:MAG: 3-hydroxyadipyl-CoA dehydrogenase [Pseudomonadota bacterium]
MNTKQHLLVVGGGTMGVDIAASFAIYGWAVTIVNPADGRFDSIQDRFDKAIARLGRPASSRPVLAQSLAEADWAGIGLVIEAAPESLPIKQRIFRELELHARPETPLCSNSSALPISSIGQGLQSQHRMLGTHYFMPAHLVPGVEVVCSAKTDPAVADAVAELLRAVGKVPIRVKRDLPGFLVNRLQHAVSREALSLMDRGIVSAEDIDAAVRFGFGFRYLAAGPCLQRDHAGLDIHHAAAGSIYPDLCNDAQPSASLTRLVSEGAMGMKAGRGFYDWTPERISSERERYETLLAAASELLAAEISEARDRKSN